MAFALYRLPVDEEGNRILGLRDTVVRLASGNSSCSACDDACGNGEILQNPAADINMVRGKVVAKVRQ